MKPEPSPRCTGGAAWPCGEVPPGAPGAPKRRKNWPSGSSSGVGLTLRTDMTFTTALPYASTSPLKSGSSRARASADGLGDVRVGCAALLLEERDCELLCAAGGVGGVSAREHAARTHARRRGTKGNDLCM